MTLKMDNVVSLSPFRLSRVLSQNEYIEINLLKNHVVTGVATQGRNSFNHWVKTYQLQYSGNKSNVWKYYQDGGTIKVL